MSHYWLVSWTPENYEKYRDIGWGIFGLPKNRSTVAKSIGVGDKLIIYTLKEQKIRAICECISGYFYSNDIVFSDGIYPHRLRTKIIVEGDVDYRNIRSKLSISQYGNLQPGLELRGGYKRLSLSDYQVIESKFSHTPVTITPIEEPQNHLKRTHGEVMKLMGDIGILLGKKVELEWRGPEYRHDVVWKDREYLPPSTVIEVCDKGVLEKDILALEWAYHNLKATALLIAINDSDFVQAKRRLPERSNILVVKAQAVEKLKDLLESDYKLIKAIFGAQG